MISEELKALVTKKVYFDSSILAVGKRRIIRNAIKANKNPFKYMSIIPITFIYKGSGIVVAVSEHYALIELEHNIEVVLLKKEDIHEVR